MEKVVPALSLVLGSFDIASRGISYMYSSTFTCTYNFSIYSSFFFLSAARSACFFHCLNDCFCCSPYCDQWRSSSFVYFLLLRDGPLSHCPMLSFFIFLIISLHAPNIYVSCMQQIVISTVTNNLHYVLRRSRAVLIVILSITQTVFSNFFFPFFCISFFGCSDLAQLL